MSSTRHYYQISRVYIGVTDFGEVEYHVEVSINKIEGVGKTLEEFLRGKGFYLVCYIGYCADEESRFAKRVDLQKVERYPLVEENIEESTILQWAKTQPVFNHYYETQKRCGCAFCPMSSKLNYAYLCKYYPDMFDFMIKKMRETELIREQELNRPVSVTSSNSKYNADYLERIIKTKYILKLEELENVGKNGL